MATANNSPSLKIKILAFLDAVNDWAYERLKAVITKAMFPIFEKLDSVIDSNSKN